jgi:hypothetical protein
MQREGLSRMRLIGSLQGYAAFSEIGEEYQPTKGVVQNELIQLVVNRYGFQGFPVLPPGTMPQPLLVFGGGKFISGDQSFAISQLAMLPNADIVVAPTTEQAELVLNDLATALDEHLGFRLHTSTKRVMFLSNIVIEFDRGVEEYINAFRGMVAAINKTRKGLPQFNIKRLAFGVGADPPPQANDFLHVMERADFVIERRQGSPYEANRYFCSAPMRTSDHIRVLEEIEAAARG